MRMSYTSISRTARPTAREVEDEVVVELDKKGEVMGIEVWGIKRKGVLKQLAQIPTRARN
jgi:uncharacterized protein YuzE